MTVVIVIETVILLVLCVLVAGLLRSYATVLERLHRLDGGTERDPAEAGTTGESARGTVRPLPYPTVTGVLPPATAQPVPGSPPGRSEWAPAHDVAGQGLSGEIVSVRTVAVDHDTVLLFLSSGCSGCAGFWEQLADRHGVAAAGNARLLVVTKGPDEESIGLLGALRPPGVDLIMSSSAWADYAVPGSPYVIVVDGRSGRVKGEGSGTSLSQVSGLMRQAHGDGASAPSLGPADQPRFADTAAPARQSGSRRPVVKPWADAERESDVDAVLLAAGIHPGHRSLYPDAPAGSTQRPDTPR